MNNFKILLNSSRPISWVNTAYPFAAGYIMAGGGINATLILGTLFFMIPYNLLMYGVNDVFDYESDILNPRKGGVEGAITDKSKHSLILWASTLLCIPFVFALVVLGNFVSSLILCWLLFFVVAYSVKGLRFKERPFIDSITSSIHFVGPLIFALSLLGANSSAAIIVVSAFFLWGIASHALGAIQDIIPDRTGGIKSIATIMGARTTIWLVIICYTLSVIFTLFIGGLAWIIGLTGVLYVLNALQFVSTNDLKSGEVRAAWKRFMKLNYLAGAVITICLIIMSL